MRYIISGGGTGGHIYPALAIAMEIKERDKEAEILYVGTERGLESELVPKEGIPFKTVRVRGLPRKINLEFFKALKELLLGLNDSRRIIKDFKPDIVIGTGGYVSGPVVFMGHLKGAKTVIHEQNAFPGITNKILAKRVNKVLITFEEARKYFKKQDNIELTGNPIRNTFFKVDRERAYREFDLKKDQAIVLAFGGSGGQAKLNDSMLKVIKENNGSKDLQIVHVTGKRFQSSFMKSLEEEGIILEDNIKVLPYIYNMPDILSISDLIITSSGAITLAEISAMGVPSILTPKAYTAENHQEYNAEAFSSKGASEILFEGDLTGENLNKMILSLVNDKEKLASMKSESEKLGNPNASREIVDIIEKI